MHIIKNSRIKILKTQLLAVYFSWCSPGAKCICHNTFYIQPIFISPESDKIFPFKKMNKQKGQEKLLLPVNHSKIKFVLPFQCWLTLEIMLFDRVNELSYQGSINLLS